MKVYVLRVDSETKHAGRAARHAAYQGVAPGGISWVCPTCGERGHGMPSGDGFSISTASHDDVCVIAIDDAGRRIGIDITPSTPPEEFGEVVNFATEWAKREAIGKAMGTGIIEDPRADIPWSVRTVDVLDEYTVVVVSDGALESIELVTTRD